MMLGFSGLHAAKKEIITANPNIFLIIISKSNALQIYQINTLLKPALFLKAHCKGYEYRLLIAYNEIFY